MPLGRANTRRFQKRSAVDSEFGHSTSARILHGRYVDISSPIKLISTTNMQVYSSPSLRQVSSSSSDSSNDSTSDLSEDGLTSSTSTAATSPTPSIPIPPMPEWPLLPRSSAPRQPAHISIPNFSRNSVVSMHLAPPIPSRAMTHTAARHRTLSHLVQPPFRLETTFELPEQRERPEEHEEERQQRPGDSSPFERELIQVDELVRTFNETQNVELAEDDALIRLKGLLCFTADAYMAEISLPFQFTWI